MDIALPAIFGLVGVAIGAGLTALLEMWRRTIDAQSAAKVIRAELVDNRKRVSDALAGFLPDHLPDSAWLAHRLQVAPFLTELQLFRLAQCYSQLDDLGRLLCGQLKGPVDKRQIVRRWFTLARDVSKMLRRLEGSRRLWLMVKFMFGRFLATPEEIREEFGLDTDERSGTDAEAGGAAGAEEAERAKTRQ